MLYYANIEEETLKELQQKLLDFLKYNFFHSSENVLNTWKHFYCFFLYSLH